MPPDDPFGSFIPPGLFSDEYRAAGGLNFQDMLGRQQEQQRQQEIAYQAQTAQRLQQAQAEQDAQVQAQRDEAQQNFVDWPTFQQLAADTTSHEPGRVYDGYLGALAYQLEQIGYSPDEVQQGVAQFKQSVPRPAEDRGFLGNLLSSAASGAESGSRAIRAAGAAARVDDETLARLAVEEAAGPDNAALARFQQAIAVPEGVDPKDFGDAVARYAKAGLTDPAGLLNFLVQQTAQSTAVIGGAVAGGVAGAAIGGPIGAAAGTAAGLFGPDFALDAGSTILDNLLDAAHERGIDPNDQRALLGLLQDPEVRDQIVSDGAAHGWPVAVVDALMSSVTYGAGGIVSRLARRGLSRRAAAVGVGTGVADLASGPAGEYLGQTQTSKGFSSAGDVVGELAGQAGPMVASGAMGFAGDRLRNRPTAVPPPGAPPIEPSLGGVPEEDLPSSGGPGGAPPAPTIDPFNRTSLTQAAQRIEPTLTQAVLDAENRIASYEVTELGPVEQINLAPVPETTEEITLTDIPEETVHQGGIGVTELPIKQTIDLKPLPEGVVNDAIALADRMVAVGVTVNDELQRALELIATAPKNMKQDAIASVIEDLGSSRNPNAEPFAAELVKLAREIQPVKKATPLQAVAAIKAVAQEIGVTPEEVLPTVAQALAEDVVTKLRDRLGKDIVQEQAGRAILDDMAEVGISPVTVAKQFWGATYFQLPAQVQDRFRQMLKNHSGGRSSELTAVADLDLPDSVEHLEGTERGFVALMQEANTRAGSPNATTTQASAAALEPEVLPARQTKRGLARGEPVPAADLASLVNQLKAGGPVEAGAAAQEAQARPRRGLRAGVAAQGPVARGLGRNIQGGAGAPVARGTTVESVTNAGDRTVRTVRGFQYGVEGTTDVANTDALARMAAEALAQKRTGGLSKKAKKKVAEERKRGIDLAVMDKAKYEETYPGRNYEADLDTFMDASEAAPGWDTAETSSPGQTPAGQYLGAMSSAARNSMTTMDRAMEYVGATSPVPLARLVANHIRSLGLEVPFAFRPIPENQGNGAFITQQGGRGAIVFLDPQRASVKTALHEATHAATLAVLRNPQTESERAAAKYINELYEYAKSQTSVQHYGFKNVAEFVAEAFSNPGFQAALAKIPLPHASKYTVWDAFKAAIMRILGVIKNNTLLSETLLTGTELFSGRTPQSALQVADQAQARRVPSTALVGTKDGARTHIAYEKNGKYTLYPTSDEKPGGIKGAGIKDLSREQVEQQMRAAGSEVLPPVADTMPKPGTPKTSSTKLVGFAPNGDLQVAAYEQKDGTWTYYESDSDVRTDPDAKVYKGLTKDQAQRYLTQRGAQTEAPTPNAVQSDGTSPTVVGYAPPKPWEVTWANRKQSDMNIGAAQRALGADINERVDIASVLGNSRADTRIRDVVAKYVEPAQRAGMQVAKDFNKTQDQIEDTLVQLHRVERAETKIRQAHRGNLDQNPQKKAAFMQKQENDITEATAKLQAMANPRFISAVRNDLAPKMKALADNTLDMSVQYGFIDRDAAENMKRAYEFYVPLQTGDRTSVGKPALGSATGGDLAFARMQEQAYRTIIRGEANRPIELVAQLVERGGLVDADGKPIATVGAGTRIFFDPETNSLNEGVDSHIFADNAIPFYRSGKRYIMTTDDDAILQAAAPYKGPQRQNALTTMLGLAGAITHTMAIGKTALSPGFSAFNLPRDIFMASVNMPSGVSRVQFAKNLVPSLITSLYNYGFKDAFGGKMTNAFSEARDVGAFISQRAYIGLDVQAKAIEAAFRPSVGQRLKKGGRGVFRVLVALSQAIESTTRYAVYKAALDSGLSKDEAAYAAKTASINFENRGLAQKYVSPLYMFGNAKLQGLHAMYKLYERASGPQVATFVLAMTTLGFLAAAYGMSHSDKDKDGKSKYSKIPDYRKDAMILFQEGGKGVPLPQEIAPFYVIGNAIGERYFGGKTTGETASRIFTNLMSASAPINVPQSEIFGHKARPIEFALRAITPSPLQPGVDIMTDRTTFGSPVVQDIEDKRKRGIPGYDMGSANEQSLAVNRAKTLQSYGVPQGAAEAIANPAKGLYRATGGIVDAAPQQIRLVNNYFNPSAEAVGFWRDMLGQREVNYEGDIVNPLERKFTGKASGFYDQDQFDELLSKATQAKYQATKQGIDALSIDDQALAKSADMLHRVESDSKALFKNQKLMSQEQRQLRQERARELLLDGIRRYNELRDRMPKR